MDGIASSGLPQGVSTVDPTRSVHLLGAADAAAIRTAEKQRAGQPWTCSKLKLEVTNATCLANKAQGLYRACQDCGIPYTLSKQMEGNDVPKAKTRPTCPECGKECNTLFGRPPRLCWSCYDDRKEKPKAMPPEADAAASVPGVPQESPESTSATVAPSEAVRTQPEASWDDFRPVTAPPKAGKLFFSVHVGGKFALSEALAKACNLRNGDRVEVRLRDKALAVRPTQEASPQARKLSAGRGGSRLAFGHVDAAQALGEIGNGRYMVEMTSWGFVAHLDRPVGGEVG